MLFLNKDLHGGFITGSKVLERSYFEFPERYYKVLFSLTKKAWAPCINSDIISIHA